MSTLAGQILILVAATTSVMPLVHRVVRGPARPRRVRTVLNQAHGWPPVYRR